MPPSLHADLQRVVTDLLGLGQTVQNPDGSTNDAANKVKKCLISTLIHSNIQCTFLISFEIMRDKETGREEYRQWESVREISERKEEESESERTKCNLSAYSDSQSLKWELTENVEDCSLIGQGHSWHFQAKLQRLRWEKMCLNYKLFSQPPVLMSRFKVFFFSPRIFALSFISPLLSFNILLTRLPTLTQAQGWVEINAQGGCLFLISLQFELRWHHLTL